MKISTDFSQNIPFIADTSVYLIERYVLAIGRKGEGIARMAQFSEGKKIGK